jgi:hypothetical protein
MWRVSRGQQRSVGGRRHGCSARRRWARSGWVVLAALGLAGCGSASSLTSLSIPPGRASRPPTSSTLSAGRTSSQPTRRSGSPPSPATPRGSRGTVVVGISDSNKVVRVALDSRVEVEVASAGRIWSRPEANRPSVLQLMSGSSGVAQRGGGADAIFLGVTPGQGVIFSEGVCGPPPRGGASCDSIVLFRVTVVVTAGSA